MLDAIPINETVDFFKQTVYQGKARDVSLNKFICQILSGPEVLENRISFGRIISNVGAHCINIETDAAILTADIQFIFAVMINMDLPCFIHKEMFGDKTYLNEIYDNMIANRYNNNDTDGE